MSKKCEYKVLPDGQVISKVTGKPMCVVNGKVTLGGRSHRHQRSVGRLVYEIFGSKKLTEKDQILHKDGNNRNNHIDNLIKVTPSERGNLLTFRRLLKGGAK